MRLKNAAQWILLRLILLTLGTSDLAGAPRYSQTVISFPSERPFEYFYEPAGRALVLEFQKTHPSELEALYDYDDTIVRRVLVKDLGSAGSEVRLILRDDRIKVLVKTYQEPFRVTLDFFDADYRPEVDPATGLPLVTTAKTEATGPEGLAPAGRPLSHTQDFSEAPAPSGGPKFSLAAKATPPHGAASVASAPVPAQPAAPSHRLMIPQAHDSGIKTAQDLVGRLSAIPEGVGNAWKTFPPYVYRLQTAALKTGKNYDVWLKQNATQAMSSHDAMAQYAGQLFDYGHEGRALLVFQKVLAESPTSFDKSAEALWKLAEIYMGQGNFSLANGYYEAMQDKHPDSPLAALAAVRRLDIKAIKASQRQKADDIAALMPELKRIRSTSGTEPHIALRSAFWGLDQAQLVAQLPDYAKLPKVDPETSEKLTVARKSSDSPRTSFLIESLILAQRLGDEAWNTETARFAGEFFDRYHGKATEPYRSQLLERSEDLLLKSIDKSLATQQYTEIVAIIESLPPTLGELKKRSNVSWAAGEAYRRLGQPALATPYYESALASSQLKANQFRAAFWLEQSLITHMGMNSVKGQAQKQGLSSKLKTADQKLSNLWKSLNDDEKRKSFTEVQPEIEDNVRSGAPVHSSPQILFEMLGQDLATTIPVPDKTVNGSAPASQPTVKMIYLLQSLAKRFAQQGQIAESRKTRQLLRKLDIKTMPADKEALGVWTNELTTLADEYREGNDYLEAGRIYALTGQSNNQWEGRAEALYKGGLLLFRAGRRDEALAAFKSAADDGNNQLYAELAKKRLEQLQQ